MTRYNLVAASLSGICGLLGCMSPMRSYCGNVRPEVEMKPQMCIDSRLAYSPAPSSVTRPFEIDLDGQAPFSSRSISDDDDTVGAVVQWWLRPADAVGLPRWALVVNRGTADGIFCLVSQEGVVEASLDDIGAVQAAYAVRAAPTPYPQILLLSNPHHGSGLEGGDFLVLEWRHGMMRRLAGGPRYADILLERDRRILTLPIVCVAGSEWFLILPSVDADAAQDGNTQASGVWNISFSAHRCTVLRWDPAAEQYRDDSSVRVEMLFPNLNAAWAIRSSY